MENRQNKPPKGGAAPGHGGQKFHTDSEQAKLHKSKLRMPPRSIVVFPISCNTGVTVKRTS